MTNFLLNWPKYLIARPDSNLFLIRDPKYSGTAHYKKWFWIIFKKVRAF